MSIQLHFHNSTSKEFSTEIDVLTAAKNLHPSSVSNVVGAFINSENEISDIRTVLKHKDYVEFVLLPSETSLEVIRHSAAHVLAQAVQALWPKTQVTIGPVIEDGFYYDFDHHTSFTDEDLILIENKMKEIIKQKLPITKEVWPSKKAIEAFKKMGESYKIELINEIGEPSVSVYKQGDWMDLCRGPHVQNLGQIGAVKLLSHSSCYWRADENKSSLQRIYGTAFHSEKDLKEHLLLLEQAKKRDHRKIGTEMNLFYFHEHSPGMPFFKPSGTTIYQELQNFIRDRYKKNGYQEVISPQMFHKDLFVKSGHLDFYKSNMYPSQISDENISFLKPMNCPGHCLLYKSQKWSYKDLPWRVADFGRLHRFERSGTLHGLTRVRSFCQDDGHVFCTFDQLQAEIKNFIQFLQNVYQSLGLMDYQIHLCTRPENKMGDDSLWDQAEEALSSSLKNMNVPYEVHKGDGAFYGPKLDIVFVDSLKRKWQLGTLQCDFNLPQAFQLKYTSEKNENQTPVLLHRAILGSLERFIGLYIEHCSGWLPLWLAPIQVALMNISKEQEAYIHNLEKELKTIKNLRIKKDLSAESLGYKIRQARWLRIPYMVIIGKKEVESQQLSVRIAGGKTVTVSQKDFISTIKTETLERKVDYSSF